MGCNYPAVSHEEPEAQRTVVRGPFLSFPPKGGAGQALGSAEPRLAGAVGVRPRGRRPPGGAARRAGPGGETPGTTPRPLERREGDRLCVPTKRVRGPPEARPRAPPAAQRPRPGALGPAGLLSPTPLPHPGHPGTARGLSPPAPASGVSLRRFPSPAAR